MGKSVGMWGEEWGRCREMCLGVGPQYTSPLLLTFPYISSYLPHTPTHFPTRPLIPLPTSPPTPQHIFLLFPHLAPPSQSEAKLPRDEVSVAKLPCGKVTGNRKKYAVFLKSCCNLTKTALFFEKSRKHFCNLTYKKKLRQTH